MTLPQGKATPHTIPPEIVEQVIDCLALHLSALYACSLTCRIWRPRAQYHLLSSIYIADTDQILAIASFTHKHPVRAAAIHRVRMNA
ncbi:hypothetical protein, partial [Aetokthonos hydrillicola]|uniref:hypothetical protein n=1 Tax=Aetokthonos hydrillicola TaxID=1550245 RepID=UPI001ABA169B